MIRTIDPLAPLRKSHQARAAGQAVPAGSMTHPAGTRTGHFDERAAVLSMDTVSSLRRKTTGTIPKRKR
jgi:hypothetical protein